MFSVAKGMLIYFSPYRPMLQIPVGNNRKKVCNLKLNFLGEQCVLSTTRVAWGLKEETKIGSKKGKTPRYWVAYLERSFIEHQPGVPINTIFS